jgi:hypothetical protein
MPRWSLNCKCLLGVTAVAPEVITSMGFRRLANSNRRCFGPSLASIDFEDLTTSIGMSAAGKTALLHALGRMFGVTLHERSLRRSESHAPADVNPETVKDLSLWIEAEPFVLQSALLLLTWVGTHFRRPGLFGSLLAPSKTLQSSTGRVEAVVA